MKTSSDPRAAQAQAWARAQLGLASGDWTPASADASFRRYFRIEDGERSWILMDAPPDKENCAPFIHVDGLLREAGLNAPQIHAQNLKRGFLLLSDLGAQTYLNVITGVNADALFTDAIAALVRWQRATRLNELPPYDGALLRRELALFPDWYVVRHLKRALTPAQRALLRTAEDALVARALAQARVYVHRDYMPRNLMISAPGTNKGCGVLDFQDAVLGPISYDVASLLRDAFLSWPTPRVHAWVRQYWEQARAAHLPVPVQFSEFWKDVELMGAQRHLKVIGIFARINYRDGKPHYLADVPRFIAYLRDAAARNDELMPLMKLFDELGMCA